MVQKFEVSGYDCLMELIRETLCKSRPIYVLFTGAKDDEGRNWCPDCVEAEPVVEDVLKTAPEDFIFILCYVGDRQTWEDPINPFRKDEILRLKRIPTLYVWNTPKRLESGQCKNVDLVSMIFEDD